MNGTAENGGLDRPRYPCLGDLKIITLKSRWVTVVSYRSGPELPCGEISSAACGGGAFLVLITRRPSNFARSLCLSHLNSKGADVKQRLGNRAHNDPIVRAAVHLRSIWTLLSHLFVDHEILSLSGIFLTRWQNTSSLCGDIVPS